MSAARTRGFTLLEAIVALTVLSMGMVALFGWLEVSTQALGRVEASADRLQDARNAMAFIETINPMESEEGEHALAGLTIRWRGELVAPEKPAVDRGGVPTPFDIGLYTLQVSCLRADVETSRFSVRKLGWRLARPSAELGP